MRFPTEAASAAPCPAVPGARRALPPRDRLSQPRRHRPWSATSAQGATRNLCGSCVFLFGRTEDNVAFALASYIRISVISSLGSPGAQELCAGQGKSSVKESCTREWVKTRRLV